MLGRLEGGQGRFFYKFRLDDVVPDDHLVRRIEALVDLGWVHGELGRYYSHTGRPSIDPELLIRMLIVGYVFAIRSERQLCAEVQVNLAYRWFCGLGIEDRVPDHSAFSRARHERFRDGQAYRQLFEHVVELCLARGLVAGAGFSVDASLIRADVNLAKQVDGAQPIDWPERASRAVREYLEALDATAHLGREPHRRAKPPKAVSLTDPLAAWVTKKYARPFFAYDANYLIDHACGIIVDAEGTCANRRHEIAAAETMLDRVRRRFDLNPRALAGDSVYGAGRLLAWLMDRGIEPHVPVWDRSARKNGLFSRSDFIFDAGANHYICPGGKTLTSTGTVSQGRILSYRGRKEDCTNCQLRASCTNGPVRKVTRDIDEELRDQVRALARTKAFEQSARQRKKVEMAFAHLKRILKLDRLRLRGLSGARHEVLLAATAQNLRKLARYAGPAPPRSLQPT
jgi:transposase